MKYFKQRHCKAKSFNCPDLDSLYVCADHIEFIQQEIGNELVDKRM